MTSRSRSEKNFQCPWSGEKKIPRSAVSAGACHSLDRLLWGKVGVGLKPNLVCWLKFCFLFSLFCSFWLCSWDFRLWFFRPDRTPSLTQGDLCCVSCVNMFLFDAVVWFELISVCLFCASPLFSLSNVFVVCFNVCFVRVLFVSLCVFLFVCVYVSVWFLSKKEVEAVFREERFTLDDIFAVSETPLPPSLPCLFHTPWTLKQTQNCDSQTPKPEPETPKTENAKTLNPEPLNPEDLKT